MFRKMKTASSIATLERQPPDVELPGRERDGEDHREDDVRVARAATQTKLISRKPRKTALS